MQDKRKWTLNSVCKIGSGGQFVKSSSSLPGMEILNQLELYQLPRGEMCFMNLTA
jgi:hypothetical protein